MLARFDDVSYRYPTGSLPVLNHVSLAIDDGEFVLLTGPSGSGKSTLARCLNGIVPHFTGGSFAGRVVVSGFDTCETQTADLASLVALVSQDPERQSVAERVASEVAFGPENLNLSNSDIGLRVEECLALLGISVLRDRSLETLSGGERQLVSIASAMATRPRLLVLDEPNSQLDNQGSALVLSAIERINDQLGTAVLLIGHRLDAALSLADRIVALEPSGSIALDGPPAQVAPRLPEPPSLVLTAGHFGWDPPPLSVREARRAALWSQPDVPHPSSGRSQSGGTVFKALPSVLSSRRLGYAYDGNPVLYHLDAGYPAGTITALLGVNGAGKSTLLKLLRGLLRPTSGQVLIDGQDIAIRSIQDLAPLIGYLPQDPNQLLFNPTVEDELRFTLRCLRRQGDIAGTLESVGLVGFESRNPLDLSGGERQRLALAAILVGDPRILLLDEPTRGMSRSLKEQLSRLLRELARDGRTIVMATHDLELAAETADLAQVLGDGRSIVHDRPRSVMAGSLSFSTTINRVFGGDVLTLDDLGISSSTSERAAAESSDFDVTQHQAVPKVDAVLRPED